jgi:ABC-type dipeptide/oligopeptide/nickel transport system ATPase component
MSALLDIRGLQVDFLTDAGTVPAVSGASLSVRAHETVVLAGESGSGKTVTALSICRILPPNARITEGSIMFEGRELAGLEDALLRNVRGKDIAYIFQEPSSYLNPLYTIGNQIDEAVMLHQGKAARDAGHASRDLLEKVGFRDPLRIYRSYPHQLSGGMNQRAFIAMALSCKPKLLIADEPTTSLDVTIEAQILKLLMELKGEYGFSLLFITHNLSIAKKIADRVYVMYRGKVVEEAGRTELFDNPRHFHTKELIGAYEHIGKL